MNKSSYWENWPDDCPYIKDLEIGSKAAGKFLTQRAATIPKDQIKNYLVIFDLDDTLFMGDPEQTLDMVENTWGSKDNYTFCLPVNISIKRLAQLAFKLGFTIVCLTARPQESKTSSRRNLKLNDIPYHQLIHNDGNEDPYFKSKIRYQFLKTGKKIICSVGDQFTDLYPCSSADTCFIKLPDPDLKCTYIYIPKI